MLSQVGGDANKELAQVVEEFEEKLQLALEYETRAFQSIADERLLITTISPPSNSMPDPSDQPTATRYYATARAGGP